MSYRNKLNDHIDDCIREARRNGAPPGRTSKKYEVDPFKKGKSSHVYFVTDGVYIKIGVADNVEFRMQQLQTGNARKLTLLMNIRYPDRTAAFWGEKEFHDYYADKRLSGEWFDIADDELLLYYFFRQETCSDDAMKFMLCRAVKTNYRDPNWSYNDRINDWKYKYLDWYDPEGRKAREAEKRKSEEKLNALFNSMMRGANANVAV